MNGLTPGQRMALWMFLAGCLLACLLGAMYAPLK
jgi:hypothetical protein